MMKNSIALWLSLGLASAAVAQSQYQTPLPDPSPPAAGASAADRDNEEPSSGASTNAGAAGGEGQLVTESIVQSKGGADQPVSLQPQSANGINYLCGGIGSDEARYMKTAARDYNLMLSFAARGGNYVADVKVGIEDAQGRPVLQTTCDGPILLVELPKSGSYRVHADAGGHTLNRNVQVKAKGHTRSLAFAWPREAVGVEDKAAFGRMSRQTEVSTGSEAAPAASGSEAETPQRATPPVDSESYQPGQGIRRGRQEEMREETPGKMR